MKVNDESLNDKISEDMAEEMLIGNVASDDLKDVAIAINRLSDAAVHIPNHKDTLKDISDTAVRKTVQENEDLKRQIVFLQQKMDVKERHIQALEKLLLEDRKPISHTSQQQNSKYIVNTTSQVI